MIGSVGVEDQSLYKNTTVQGTAELSTHRSAEHNRKRKKNHIGTGLYSSGDPCWFSGRCSDGGRNGGGGGGSCGGDGRINIDR